MKKKARVYVKDNQRMRCVLAVMCTLVIVCSFGRASAASKQYLLERIKNSDNLSNSSINKIFQDKDGFLWFGTWDGLNKYNGRDIEVLRPSLTDTLSIGNQVILDILEDGQGNVWLNTLQGISMYNRSSRTSLRFFEDSKIQTSEREYDLCSYDGVVYYCSKAGELGFFQDGKAVELSVSSSKKIKAFDNIFILDGIVFIYDGEAVYFINLDALRKGSGSLLKLKNEVDQFISSKGRLFCLEQNNALEVFVSNNSPQDSIFAKNILDFYGVGSNSYWCVSSAHNVEFRDLDGNVYEDFDLLDIGFNIRCILEDSEGIVWVGTDGGAIYKLTPKLKDFSLVQFTKSNGLEGGIVRSFCRVDQNNVLVGTKGKGLLDYDGDSIRSIKELSGRSIYTIDRYADNIFLLGTESGLCIYDAQKETLIGELSNITVNGEQREIKYIYSLLVDKDSTVWVGTNGYGLFSLHLKDTDGHFAVENTELYEKVDFEGKDVINSNIIFSILQENDSLIWIGTRIGGLSLLNKNTGEINAVGGADMSYEVPVGKDILCMSKSADGTLYVGTNQGINEVKMNDKDPFKPEVHTYSSINGLNLNTINGIVCEDDDKIWFSTNKGIYLFEKDVSKLWNYNKLYGLQDNEFADGAFMYDSLYSQVWFGGIAGFNYFKPDYIKSFSDIPNLSIEVKVQNQDKYLYSGVVYPAYDSEEELVLESNQNFLDITVSSLTNLNNSACRYMYYLEGFDKMWNNNDGNGHVVYTKLPPGNYKLHFKWTNGDGVWGGEVLACKIVVKPIIWWSFFAKLVYLVALSVLIFILTNLVRRRNQLKQRVKQKEQEEQTYEDKLAFFANVAHELQTPITLIVGPASELSKRADVVGKNKWLVSNINKNSNRLLYLTQQLLEFTKIENADIKIERVELNIVELVKQILALFSFEIEKKNIGLSVSAEETILGYFDLDKMEKIIFNLISNAVKYTPKGGTVKLNISIIKSDCKITINNSGEGISEENIENIFNKYVTVKGNVGNSNWFQTGLGLSYTKKLTELLGGGIEVRSVVGDYTEFEVLMPLRGPESIGSKQVKNIVLSDYIKNQTLYTDEDYEEKYVDITIKNKRVLLVEDDKSVRDYIVSILGRDYIIQQAQDGYEAIALIEQDAPDIIISDVMMPNLDGIELCKFVKDSEAFCTIPVILLTAKTSVEHRIEGIENGANSYIPKPFLPRHLEVRVEQLLRERESVRRHFVTDGDIASISPAEVKDDDKMFMDEVIAIIQENVENEDLNQAFLANKMSMSESSLYRSVKRISDRTPSEVVKITRLKVSADLLLKSKLSVTEVFFRSGFNNRAYFYKEFKKIYGMTPGQYREYFSSL